MPRAQPGQRLHDDVAACRARAALDDLLQDRQGLGRGARAEVAEADDRVVPQQVVVRGTPFEVVRRRHVTAAELCERMGETDLLRECRRVGQVAFDDRGVLAGPELGQGLGSAAPIARARAHERGDAPRETLVGGRWAGSAARGRAGWRRRDRGLRRGIDAGRLSRRSRTPCRQRPEHHHEREQRRHRRRRRQQPGHGTPRVDDPPARLQEPGAAGEGNHQRQADADVPLLRQPPRDWRRGRASASQRRRAH